jgi:hypothetical protein
MKTSLTLALLVLAAAVAVAGCGSTSKSSTSQPLTKSEVIKRGSAICKAAERRIASAPQIRSQHPFAKNAPKGDAARATNFLAAYADSLSSVRSGLGRLDAPAQGDALLKGFVSDLGPTVAAFRHAHADAVAGKGQAAEQEAQTGFELFAKASRKTKAYGFPSGVCQSGSSS